MTHQIDKGSGGGVDPVIAFFVQNNQVERLTIPVAEYAHRRGYVIHDRSSTSELDVDHCDIDWSQFDAVIPYGSVQFLRQVKASNSLGQFVLHSESAFSACCWMPIFGSEALNGQGEALSESQVIERLAQGQRLHLRPDSVDKAFPGGVYDHDSWLALKSERHLQGDLLCWASPLKTLSAEYRCWLVGDRVVEVSRYRESDQMSVKRVTDGEVYRAAESFAKIYLPAPCVVMDIALTEEGYKLIEFNPIHSSGWYDASVTLVMDSWVAWTKEAV